MKKYTVSILFVLFIFSGCAIGLGQHQDGFETPTGYRSHKVAYFGQQYHETAISLAQAEKILSQARLNDAFAESIKSGSQEFYSNGFRGIIINENREKRIILNDPYQSQEHELEPRQSISILCPKIPSYIKGIREGSNDLVSFKMFLGPIIYDGVRYDFGARIR